MSPEVWRAVWFCAVSEIHNDVEWTAAAAAAGSYKSESALRQSLHSSRRFCVSALRRGRCRDSNGCSAPRRRPPAPRHCPPPWSTVSAAAAAGGPAGRRRRQAPFNEDKCRLFVFYSGRSAPPDGRTVGRSAAPRRAAGPRRSAAAASAADQVYTSFVARPADVFHPICVAHSLARSLAANILPRFPLITNFHSALALGWCTPVWTAVRDVFEFKTSFLLNKLTAAFTAQQSQNYEDFKSRCAFTQNYRDP